MTATGAHVVVIGNEKGGDEPWGRNIECAGSTIKRES